MREKIKNILDHMIKSGSKWSVKSYTENPDGSFELETKMSEYNHLTFLQYSATGDNEMFRIEIKHVFGFVDVDIPPQNAAGQLLRMLAHNTGSFSDTTAFIGVESDDDTGTFYATLNSFHHFVSSWSDADIAKALSLHLFDLMMGLTTKDTALTMLGMFGDDN
jgi:hypothetical protein